MKLNGVELERKWNGKLTTEKVGEKENEMEWKQNGDGMEKKMTNQVEAKFDGMELKGNGNGMEKVGDFFLL